jgi:hypothetical protein
MTKAICMWRYSSWISTISGHFVLLTNSTLLLNKCLFFRQKLSSVTGQTTGPLEKAWSQSMCHCQNSTRNFNLWGWRMGEFVQYPGYPAIKLFIHAMCSAGKEVEANANAGRPRKLSKVHIKMGLWVIWSRIFKLLIKEPKNRFQGINSASICSLAGRYDNPIPTRFLYSPYRLVKKSSTAKGS